MIEAPTNTGTTPQRKQDAQHAVTEHGAASFDGVLAGIQSAQLAIAAQRYTDDTGLAVRDSGSPDATHARVTAETTEARQAEVEAKASGRTQDAALGRGSQDTCLERLAAEQREQRPTDPSGKAGQQTETQSPRLDRPSSESREPVATRLPEVPPAKQPVHDNAEVRANPAAASRIRSGEQGGATGQAAPQPAPARTDAAGSATSVTNVKQVGASAARSTSESSAQAVAKLLSERGSAEPARAQPDASTTNPGRPGSSTGKTQQETDAAVMRRDGTGPAKANETSNARRMEFENLVRNIRLNVGTRSSSATIRLNPPELGAVRIDVRMVDDTVGVRVEAATQHARDLLTSRAAELTAALREHHIDVQRFEVVAAHHANDSPDNSSGGAMHQSPADAGRQEPSGGGSAGNRPNDLPAGPQETAEGGAMSMAESAEAAADARLDIRV